MSIEPREYRLIDAGYDAREWLGKTPVVIEAVSLEVACGKLLGRDQPVRTEWINDKSSIVACYERVAGHDTWSKIGCVYVA